ncbi:MAG: hypothetical protein J6U21_07280, partial [Bacteroidales bacterium]|nr:hypothetical protein [Bacteroidales bacterium]
MTNNIFKFINSPVYREEGTFLFYKFFIAIVMVMISMTAAVAQTGGTDGNFNAGITSPEGGLTCNVQFSNGQ